jgi:hypothetical protein
MTKPRTLGVKVEQELYDFYKRLAKVRLQKVSVTLRTILKEYYEECKKIENQSI